MSTPDTTRTTAERQALARCHECFDDGQDTDVGRLMLNRLVELGGLQMVGRARWEVTHEGGSILTEMEVT